VLWTNTLFQFQWITRYIVIKSIVVIKISSYKGVQLIKFKSKSHLEKCKQLQIVFALLLI
jgi:hypothetical protein